MQQAPFPSAADLGEVAAFVASTLFQRSFATAQSEEGAAANVILEEAAGRMTLLMQGTPDWLLMARWDQGPASAQLSKAAEQGGEGSSILTLSAVGELLNVVAGQLKSRYDLRHKLGLPHSVSSNDGYVMASGGPRAVVWLLEGDGAQRLQLELRCI